MTHRLRQAITSPVVLAGVIPALIAWAVTALSVSGYLS